MGLTLTANPLLKSIPTYIASTTAPRMLTDPSGFQYPDATFSYRLTGGGAYTVGLRPWWDSANMRLITRVADRNQPDLGCIPATSYDLKLDITYDTLVPDSVTGAATTQGIILGGVPTMLPPGGTGTHIYVRKTGNDGNDGLTGATAKLTFAAAIAIATANCKITLGAGTYTPDGVAEALASNYGKPGTSANWIYVESEDPLNMAVLSGGNPTGLYAGIFEHAAGYWCFKDLIIQDAYASCFIMGRPASGTGASDLWLYNCIVRRWCLTDGHYGPAGVRQINDNSGRVRIVNTLFDMENQVRNPSSPDYATTGATYTYGNNSTGGNSVVGSTFKSKGSVNCKLDSWSTGPEGSLTSGWGFDGEFTLNFVDSTADDGLQAEGGCRNVGIWNNKFYNCYVGLGLSQPKTGPVWIYRNQWLVDALNYSGWWKQTAAVWLKLGANALPMGVVFLFNNTYFADTIDAVGYGFEGVEWNGGAGSPGVVSRNNIIVAAGTLAYYWFRTMPQSWDYDLVCCRKMRNGQIASVWWVGPYTIDGYTPPKKIIVNDTGYKHNGVLIPITLQGIRDVMSNTQEMNAVEVAIADVATILTDTTRAGWNFTPPPGSPAIGAGTPVDGITTGGAPDIGAVDSGSAPPTYNLTLQALVGGTWKLDGSPIAAGVYPKLQGSTHTLEVVPDPGKSFVAWTGDISGTQNPYSLTTSADTTVGATITAGATWNLATERVGNGAIGGAGQYADSAVASVSATPGSDSAIEAYEGDASGSTSPQNVTMTLSDKLVRVVFKQITYAVKVAIRGSGSVAEGSGRFSYVKGSSHRFTATPSLTFLEWRFNNVVISASPALDFTPTADGVLTAVFVG